MHQMAAPPSLEEDLKALEAAINNLPASYRSGSRKGPLAKYLTPGQSKGDDPTPVFPAAKDGAYQVFNERWEHVFQKLPGDPDDKLIRLSLIVNRRCLLADRQIT
jgi:hypothetical protein